MLSFIVDNDDIDLLLIGAGICFGGLGLHVIQMCDKYLMRKEGIKQQEINADMDFKNGGDALCKKSLESKEFCIANLNPSSGWDRDLLNEEFQGYKRGYENARKNYPNEMREKGKALFNQYQTRLPIEIMQHISGYIEEDLQFREAFVEGWENARSARVSEVKDRLSQADKEYNERYKLYNAMI